MGYKYLIIATNKQIFGSQLQDDLALKVHLDLKHILLLKLLVFYSFKIVGLL